MTFTLYWTSGDQQGDIAMGDYATEAEAHAAIQSAEAEMLATALDDGPDTSGLMTKSAIKAGTWSVL